MVFGSVARDGLSLRDVDLGVKLSDGRGADLLNIGGVVCEVAGILGVSEDRVDVVDIDRAPIHLLWRILKEGIVVKGSEAAVEELEKRVEPYPDLLAETKHWMNVDPDPKVDKIILESRVAEVRRNVDYVKGEVLTRKPGDLRYGEVLALERALHRIAEAMLDMCRHLAAVYSLGLVESYGEYPEKLAYAGKMPGDLAEKLGKLAGLMDILVHGYLEMKTELIYEAAEEVAGELAGQFIKWVGEMDP
ncbi:MAG: HepT-like ribonuclease domain-containing protein [Candidatus Bathyarchaeia archaeon]